MDPTDLLPGLVRVIEERLGRFGRPFTTLIVVFAGLGVVAWGYERIVSAWVGPILSNDVEASAPVRFAILAFLCGGTMAVWYRFASHPLKQRIKELEQKLADYECKSSPLSDSISEKIDIATNAEAPIIHLVLDLSELETGVTRAKQMLGPNVDPTLFNSFLDDVANGFTASLIPLSTGRTSEALLRLHLPDGCKKLIAAGEAGEP